MFKKFMKTVLAVGMALSLGACGSKQGGETVTLKVWGAQDDQAMLGEMIEAFKEANPDKTWDITLGVVGEPDAKAKYLEDPAAAADVFAFPNDQLYELIDAGALYKVTRNKDAVVKANMEGAIDAASKGDELYAYPFSADNGYFLYYNKAALSDTDIATLDGLMAAANTAGKKVFMDVSNGYYIASFLIAAGAQFSMEDPYFSIDKAKGVAALDAVKAFTADKAFLTGDDNVLKAGFQDGSIIAGVSGQWNSKDIAEILGDNYAATKLPTFTLAGEQVQMGSFVGYKLMGVNSQTDFPEEAMALAEWLTNEENQLIRFQKREIGPSNLNVAASDEVKANVALSALAAQSVFGISQKDVVGEYWTPAEAVGTALEGKDYSKTSEELLDNLQAQIVAEKNK